MIGQTISHYRILEKLRQTNGGQVGEVPNFPTSLRVVGSLSIPACLTEFFEAGRRPPSSGGSCMKGHI